MPNTPATFLALGNESSHSLSAPVNRRPVGHSDMRTSTRRKFGGLLALLALTAVAVLALADVPLVTMSSRHFDATGATTYSVRPHWPLVVAFVVFLAGVALIFFPRHENTA